ncbi:hypothetical protein LCGC14_2216100, partial [marine sediment metagenome]
QTLGNDETDQRGDPEGRRVGREGGYEPGLEPALGEEQESTAGAEGEQGNAPEKPPETDPSPEPAQSESDPDPAPAPEPAQSTERPYPPDTVKASVLEAVERFKGTNRNAKITEHQTFAEFAQWQLNECFNEPDQTELIGKVLLFLFGKASIDDLNGAQCRAILDWLKPSKNKVEDIVPNALSMQEARLIAQLILAETAEGNNTDA